MTDRARMLDLRWRSGDVSRNQGYNEQIAEADAGSLRLLNNRAGIVFPDTKKIPRGVDWVWCWRCGLPVARAQAVPIPDGITSPHGDGSDSGYPAHHDCCTKEECPMNKKYTSAHDFLTTNGRDSDTGQVIGDHSDGNQFATVASTLIDAAFGLVDIGLSPKHLLDAARILDCVSIEDDSGNQIERLVYAGFPASAHEDAGLDAGGVNTPNMREIKIYACELKDAKATKNNDGTWKVGSFTAHPPRIYSVGWQVSHTESDKYAIHREGHVERPDGTRMHAMVTTKRGAVAIAHILGKRLGSHGGDLGKALTDLQNVVGDAGLIMQAALFVSKAKSRTGARAALASVDAMRGRVDLKSIQRNVGTAKENSESFATARSKRFTAKKSHIEWRNEPGNYKGGKISTDGHRMAFIPHKGEPKDHKQGHREGTNFFENMMEKAKHNRASIDASRMHSFVSAACKLGYRSVVVEHSGGDVYVRSPGLGRIHVGTRDRERDCDIRLNASYVKDALSGAIGVAEFRSDMNARSHATGTTVWSRADGETHIIATMCL